MKTLYRIGPLLSLVLPFLTSCASLPHREGVAIDRTMTVTAYCPCQQCCVWKRTWYGKTVYASGPHAGEYKRVGVTASGAKARVGTVAADPTYPFGTRMYIPGYGEAVVEDRGGAIRGDHVDVFFKHHRQAVNWGKQKLVVRIWLPPNHPMLAAK